MLKKPKQDSKTGDHFLKTFVSFQLLQADEVGKWKPEIWMIKIPKGEIHFTDVNRCD